VDSENIEIKVDENFRFWFRNHFENSERIFQCAKYLKINDTIHDRSRLFVSWIDGWFGIPPSLSSIADRGVRTQFNEWTV